MLYRELEFRCDTCNIELIIIDSVFSSHRKYDHKDLKKLSKHRNKGHKIIDIPRSVFHDSYGFKSIPDTDVVTKYIFENNKIIIP